MKVSGVIFKMKKLTHLDRKGGAVMVDVTGKKVSDREAVARGVVYMKKATLKLISDVNISKGNVLETSKIAGIMAAKRVDELIPLCHQLNISSVSMNFSIFSGLHEMHVSILWIICLSSHNIYALLSS